MQSSQIPVACFAPALTDAALSKYESVVGSVQDQRLRDALSVCLECVKAWWAIPESKRRDGRRFMIVHKGNLVSYSEVPLEEEQVKSLWSSTPWMDELLLIQSLFDDIPLSNKEIRDCAFHLLWHCKEISLDREPMTVDKLGS